MTYKGDQFHGGSHRGGCSFGVPIGMDEVHKRVYSERVTRGINLVSGVELSTSRDEIK